MLWRSATRIYLLSINKYPTGYIVFLKLKKSYRQLKSEIWFLKTTQLVKKLIFWGSVWQNKRFMVTNINLFLAIIIEKKVNLRVVAI